MTRTPEEVQAIEKMAVAMYIKTLDGGGVRHWDDPGERDFWMDMAAAAFGAISGCGSPCPVCGEYW